MQRYWTTFGIGLTPWKVPKHECLKVVDDAMRIWRRGGERGKDSEGGSPGGVVRNCRAAGREVSRYIAIDLKQYSLIRYDDAKSDDFEILRSQKLISRYVSFMTVFGVALKPEGRIVCISRDWPQLAVALLLMVIEFSATGPNIWNDEVLNNYVTFPWMMQFSTTYYVLGRNNIPRSTSKYSMIRSETLQSQLNFDAVHRKMPSMNPETT
jgi:hypothetical protein